ncbi:DUF2937 family protein [Glaciecola sp. MH2013]|uniref:DUF2937 family protein n=1 Tax=Glaciecola sp. MH2013 TaxID=2785524 RepID=UPI00189D4CFF|nr:DUF2937 family protein [Glaciecola sp. MH2013]MBF7071984.1 DUF2937 family protein [Glaciecola sp. MH2013]
MILSTLDKLFFGLTLLFALQVPQFTDQYYQFIAGVQSSNQWQIDGYQQVANKYNYASIEAMIAHHLNNEVDSVRDDALQKQQTIARFNAIENGLSIFEKGNLLQKLAYIASANGREFVGPTLKQFSFGLPISTEGIVFGVVFGLLLNLLFSAPARVIVKKRKARKQHAKR